MQEYCMKCCAKNEIKNPKSIGLMNKKPATQGVFPDCGTMVFSVGRQAGTGRPCSTQTG